jgi:hypothetical protein
MVNYEVCFGINFAFYGVFTCIYLHSLAFYIVFTRI